MTPGRQREIYDLGKNCYEQIITTPKNNTHTVIYTGQGPGYE